MKSARMAEKQVHGYDRAGKKNTFRMRICGAGTGSPVFQMRLIHCLLALVLALASVVGVSSAEEGIHHNLPDNLEIIDPKTLGLSGTDLENFLGNVKLLPLGNTFGGGAGSPKAQILTVGFDGNEQLNLEDFAPLSSDGLGETADVGDVAEMAFSKFKEFFQNPSAAKNFDDVHGGNANNNPQDQGGSPTPQAPTVSSFPSSTIHSRNNQNYQNSFSEFSHETERPTQQSFESETELPFGSKRPVPKKKRVRINKRPVLFSSTFKSNNLGNIDENALNGNQDVSYATTGKPDLQDYARVIQELQTKAPVTSYRNHEQHFSNDTTKTNHHRRPQFHHHQQQLHPTIIQSPHQGEGITNEPKPHFDSQRPAPQQQNDQHFPTTEQSLSPPPTSHQPNSYENHNFGQEQQFEIAFPTPYFVAPSAVAPAQYFPQPPAPPTTASAQSSVSSSQILQQFSAPAAPVQQHHHQQPQQVNSNRGNNFLQQQSQYFPLLPVPTEQTKPQLQQPVQASFAPPPPPLHAPVSYQQEQQLAPFQYNQQPYNPPPIPYNNQQQEVHFTHPPPNYQSPAPQSQSTTFNFDNNQHNRFNVQSQPHQHHPKVQATHQSNHFPAHAQQHNSHYYKPQPQNQNAGFGTREVPSPPQLPLTSTTPRPYSSQGIFQVTPSMKLIPMATVENAMSAYKSRLDRQKSLELSATKQSINVIPNQNQIHQIPEKNYYRDQPAPLPPMQNQQVQQYFVPPVPPVQPSSQPQHQQYHRPQPFEQFKPMSSHENAAPIPAQNQNYFPIIDQRAPKHNFPLRPPQPQPLPPGPSAQYFGGQTLRQESKDFKQQVTPPPRPPTSYAQESINFRVPAPPSPSNFGSGPSPPHSSPSSALQNTRQQSTIGNLLAPIRQRMQAAFDSMFKSQIPPSHPPKLTVNFRGQPPAYKNFQQTPQIALLPPSAPANGQPAPSGPIPHPQHADTNLKFQASPSTYHPLHLQKQHAHLYFRQTPVPPPLPPLYLRSPQPLPQPQQQHHPVVAKAFTPSQQYNSHPGTETSRNNNIHLDGNNNKLSHTYQPPQSNNNNPHQPGQLKIPEPKAVVINNKSNSPDPALDLHHQEASLYTQALGYHVQSITSAPLISSFTVKLTH